MKICVYGAASPTVDPVYIEAVEEMGREMVARDHSLIFGGGANGLMGAAARGVRDAGGNITGVIPKFFGNESIEEICDYCDKLIETDTMRERKQIMEENADAFIVVPGGIGTLEEFFETLTLKQLCRHNKPIAIYNVKGYYNGLEQFMEQAANEYFVRNSCKKLYLMTDNLKELFSYIENKQPQNYTVKDLKVG